MRAPRPRWRGWMLRPAILAVLLAVPVPSSGFKPKFHLDETLGALEGAGFSYGQVWLLSFFDLEIDIATELPRDLCCWPVRWPFQNSQDDCCSGVVGGEIANPCSGIIFLDLWAKYCLPFHCPGDRKDKEGLEQVTQEWRLESMTAPLHGRSGGRCFDWMEKYGHMLHAVQDFYAHSNWVETFHVDLGFDFDEIPTWTTFQKAQRGGKRNLILLQHAGGDKAKAEKLYDLLDQGLKVENHDKYNKDSDWSLSPAYNSGSRGFHKDSDGHDVVDFHKAADFLAGTETYQLGLQTRLNIVNNPKLGSAEWNNLFQCLSEMAAFDGKSEEKELSTYKKAIGRLRTYSTITFLWH
jgi:hypothetical protein